MGRFISYLKARKMISTDYDITVHYHPRKANVLVDALSRLSMTCSISYKVLVSFLRLT